MFKVTQLISIRAGKSNLDLLGGKPGSYSPGHTGGQGPNNPSLAFVPTPACLPFLPPDFGLLMTSASCLPVWPFWCPPAPDVGTPWVPQTPEGGLISSFGTAPYVGRLPHTPYHRHSSSTLPVQPAAARAAESHSNLASDGVVGLRGARSTVAALQRSHQLWASFLT